VERYVSELTDLAHTLIRLIAAALSVPRDEVMTHFAKPTTFLRLLRYPPQRQEDGLFGSAPHTDYGFITLLAQDEVGGLEVRNKAGEWIAAPPILDTFVMNVGDILARWSNDRFVSTRIASSIVQVANDIRSPSFSILRWTRGLSPFPPASRRAPNPNTPP
jgi:isopenicillin N synthase-like dioxygenase